MFTPSRRTGISDPRSRLATAALVTGGRRIAFWEIVKSDARHIAAARLRDRA
jgi:hypothetical protein